MPETNAHQQIALELKKLGHFCYFPNQGNLGDQLLATATRQFFNRHHLSFHTFTKDNLQNPCTLVYGGGGAFVPFWNATEYYQEMLTHPNIVRCIILPHSLYRADALVTAFDERHIIYCREKQSYDYCRSLNKKAIFRLGDDMAFALDMDSLPKLRHRLPMPLIAKTVNKLVHSITGRSGHRHAMLKRWIKERRQWNDHFLNRLRSKVASSLITDAQGRKVAFFMRTDEESAFGVSNEHFLDLSLQWNSQSDDALLCDQLSALFLESVNQADIVVTDRLHVGIAASLLNKELYWLDNVYHKISGIAHYSLAPRENIHLLSRLEEIPEHIISLLH